MKNKKYTEFVNDALKNISEFSNGNIVLGDPITTPNGVTVITVSKITVGLLSGRGEYGEIKMFQCNKHYPHSNAGGGVVSIKPCGFLIEKGKSVKFIECPQDIMDKTINAVTSCLGNANENS